MKNNLAAIILAAGRGERMKSKIPKVMHPICGRPMLDYILDLVSALKFKKVVAVLGHQHHQTRKLLQPGIKVVIQKRLLGTADAVKEAQPALKNFKGTVLVLYADNPLLEKETIQELLRHHIKNNLDATLLTAKMEKPQGYGRILRDKYGSISGIAEEKDADDYQKEIKEINTGVMCFKKERLFQALRCIKPNNRKKEYYLTDAIGIIYKNGGLIDNVALSDIDQALGINSRRDLAQVNKIMQRRIHQQWLERGVTIVDPETTFIGYRAKIGQDTVIYPFTVIESSVKIGRHCQIGPFAHLRQDTKLEDEVAVGNFLEIARSQIASRTLLKHFGYIGDSKIGKQVNIGAGTVTANFDGKRKNITLIKDKAFIGSDTVLIAPVRIGKAARTGAGAVVARNKDVPDRTTVVGVPARPLKK